MALLPAYFYYVQDRAGGGESIFQPARRAIQTPGPLPHPSPVATLENMIWSTGGTSGSPYEPVHGVYFGILLLGFALWPFGIWTPKRNEEAWPYSFGGTILALGPCWTFGGQVMAINAHLIPLPVSAIEALGYPTQIGGLYYRYTIIAAPGSLYPHRSMEHPSPTTSPVGCNVDCIANHRQCPRH